MVIGLTVTKPLAVKFRSLCTLVGKSMHAKVMAVFRHKIQLDVLIQFPYILVGVQSICSWSIPVNCMEIKATDLYAENAWTDISEKSKIKFMDKNISMLDKTTRRFNYKPKLCQNAALC